MRSRRRILRSSMLNETPAFGEANTYMASPPPPPRPRNYQQQLGTYPDTVPCFGFGISSFSIKSKLAVAF